MKILNPTKKQIEEHLAKIGWSLRNHGCEHYYFYNHKKRCVGLYLLFPETDGRLEFDMKNWRTPSFTFYLKDVEMELLEDTAVSFCGKDNRSIFILCPNYDKKKITKPTTK